jgi:hypothetical protein
MALFFHKSFKKTPLSTLQTPHFFKVFLKRTNERLPFLLLAQLNREFRCGMRNRSRQGTKLQEYWGRSARILIQWINISVGRAEALGRRLFQG